MQPGLSNQTRLFTVAPKTFLMNDRFSSVYIFTQNQSRLRPYSYNKCKLSHLIQPFILILCLMVIQTDLNHDGLIIRRLYIDLLSILSQQFQF